jgi:phosphate acetyltransferase
MTNAYGRFGPLVERARSLGPIPTAVVYPCSGDALAAAVEAHRQGIIRACLVGPAERIRELASAEKVDLADCSVADHAEPGGCALAAARMVHEGTAAVLMKGSLHTDELMAALVSREAGLRTSRRISHVMIVDVPAHDRLLLITDAAINIAPGLVAKRDILQNAIDLAPALGIAAPKVAILSAVETINPDIPSTIDAAALCKMADRGQITGAILDGPLAFDNAISAEAARIKGIVSPVAGQPDILLVPGLEAGNMLYKQLVFLSGAMVAGIVLGSKVPVVLTSRADSRASRIASSAVAGLLAHFRAGHGR